MVGRRLHYSASPDPGRGWGYCVHPLIRATQSRGLTLDGPLRKPDRRAARREREKDAKAAVTHVPMVVQLLSLSPRAAGACPPLERCLEPTDLVRLPYSGIPPQVCPLLRGVLANGAGNSKMERQNDRTAIFPTCRQY